MDIRIVEIKREDCPAARFVGKRYADGPNWGEWWENGWFDLLEAMEGLVINDHGYIGMARVVDGKPEWWIGMFFPEGTAAPEGFDYMDIGPMRYGVCYLYGREDDPGLYSPQTHERCRKALAELGLRQKTDDWCFERYNCPRFTTPDEQGGVILDYGISIERDLPV